MTYPFNPGGGGGAVSSVSAGDASAVISPTTGAVVVEAGTLDQIANLHAPAANWSNNSKRITSLGAGVAGTDGAQIGQTVTGILTTEGDLVYVNASGQVVRLPVGSASGVNGYFLGISSGVPAWLYPSGQFLCAPTAYGPASQTQLTVTGTTMAAFSSANVNTGSFTAPASGSVLVTASFTLSNGTGGSVMNIGLADHGTTTMVASFSNFGDGASNTARAYTVRFLISGLTAGSSYNFDLMGGNGTAGDSITIDAYGFSSTTATTTPGSPVIMTVQAV